MSVQPGSQAITPLRRRMLEDMAMRGLRADTQRDYIRFVRSFAAFLRRSPDTASAEDVRRFQVHQAESGVQPPTINCSVSALRFFFTVTLDRPDLSRRLVLVRYPNKLPTVLSVEEVGRLLECAPGPKYRAALGTAYGAGLRVSEVAALKVGDIDNTRMLIRVEQGKSLPLRRQGAARTVMPCCRRNCWNCCDFGGARASGAASCCRRAGCFLAGTPSSRFRPANSTGLCMRQRKPRALRNVSPRTRFATHLLEQDVDIRVIQVLLSPTI
jgi:integrase/recombinase XerD